MKTNSDGNLKPMMAKWLPTRMQEYDDVAGNRESLVVVGTVARNGGKRCGSCGQSAIDKAAMAYQAEQQHRRIRFRTG